MFLIGLRFVIVLAIAYLFGLLVAWVLSFFNGSDGDGWDDDGNEPISPIPPEPGEDSKQKTRKKRLVEVDESYYLEEFDLRKNK